MSHVLGCVVGITASTHLNRVSYETQHYAHRTKSRRAARICIYTSSHTLASQVGRTDLHHVYGNYVHASVCVCLCVSVCVRVYVTYTLSTNRNACTQRR